MQYKKKIINYFFLTLEWILQILMAVAAFMRMAMMLSIMDMLMLVHLAIVIMRMGMLICGMTAHCFFTSVLLT